MKLIDAAIRCGNKLKFMAICNEDKLWFCAGGGLLTLAIFSAAKAGKKCDDILTRHNEKMAEKKNVDHETEEERREDRWKTNGETALEIAKAVAPTAGLAFGSLICFGKSNGVVQKRYISMAAAYASVLNDKLHLEDMIRKRDGQEILDKMKEGEKETVTDYNTGEVREELKEGQKANYDAYAKFFDESNPNWEKNPETNRFWLHGKENYANYLLKRHGYLFLNDVYDMLDLPKTQAGQIMGWKYYDDVKEAEFHGAANKVLFGILDGDSEANRNFVNGYERSILLKFNIDPEPIIGCVGFREA